LCAKNDSATLIVKEELSKFGTIYTDAILSRLFIKSSGVNLEKCEQRVENSLPTSTVIVNTKNGSRTILHHNSKFPEPTFEEFRQKFTDFSKYRAIYFEGH